MRRITVSSAETYDKLAEVAKEAGPKVKVRDVISVLAETDKKRFIEYLAARFNEIAESA